MIIPPCVILLYANHRLDNIMSGPNLVEPTHRQLSPLIVQYLLYQKGKFLCALELCQHVGLILFYTDFFLGPGCSFNSSFSLNHL